MNKDEQEKGGPEIFKMKFYSYSPVFPVGYNSSMNIKQTIMKDYNIQSSQLMTCDCFRQLFLLCTIFRYFFCTVHYFLCAFSAKMATYSLGVLENKQEQTRKEGESKLGNPERTHFLNVPLKESCPMD